MSLKNCTQRTQRLSQRALRQENIDITICLLCVLIFIWILCGFWVNLLWLKEAKLIIECVLTAITTPDPSDFYSQESKDYIDEAYKDANDYRKLVFGEITHVWVKK